MPRTQTAAAAMPATNGQIQQPVRRRTRRRGRPAGSTSRSGAATGMGTIPSVPTGQTRALNVTQQIGALAKSCNLTNNEIAYLHGRANVPWGQFA